MAKKDLKGGLANILSGADRTVTESSKERDLFPGEVPTVSTITQEETDLINTVDDPELREELKEKLKQKRMIGRGRPRKNDQLGKPTDGYDRTSLIVNKAKWAKIKEIGFIETLTMKEIMELAIDIIIERYEKKHGVITPMQREKKDIRDIF